MKFRRFIKNFDIFGYVIRLRFNGKGDSHQTLLGGIVTIVTYVFVIAYTAILCQKMVTFGQDVNNSYQLPQNSAEQQVSWKDLNMDIFINIYDLRQQKWVPYDSHLKKYINITGINYSSDTVNLIFNQTQVEFKPCNENEVLNGKPDQY